MRIASGDVTKYAYFVAVDDTDFVTRETGFSSFTVYRSRNGGASSVMTTPTINETDTTNMPGVYELLLDEDMTIDGGDETQEMAFHITHAGMAPVTRTVELFRPQPDPTVGAGGISVTAESFTAAGAEPETNTYTSTVEEDGTYHIVEDDATSTDVYYQFDIGGGGVPQSATWTGYAQSNGDTYTVHFYNWGGAAWEQVASIDASNGTTPSTETWTTTTAHVGTGANLGKVRLRFLSSDGTAIATDRVLVSYTVSNQSIGYEGGAVWFDDSLSNTNTESFVDGTADNPVSTLAAARTIADNLNLKIIHCLPGTTATLTAVSWDSFELKGRAFSVALASRSIDGITIYNAVVTGIGEATTTQPTFIDCSIGAATIPPSQIKRCGIGYASGTFTAAVGSGQYVLTNCYSEVPGSSSPVFDFSPVTGATGVNNRGWSGGATYTLDSNCTLSHEVEAGGATTITTGGGDAEVRGICRALTVVLSAAETVQFVGVCGPVTLSGTTTATVNLYGIAASVTDTTSAATVTNSTVQDYLNVAHAEPTGAPAANETPLDKLAYMFAALRNEIQVTSTVKTFTDDAGAELYTKGLSDDGTTYIETEAV